MNNNLNDLKSILASALEVHNRLENKDYAPINKSHVMLKKILKYYEGNIKNLDAKQVDEVNVGLLAAKSLDFDEEFHKYAELLHEVWGSFLSILSNSYSKYPYSIPSCGPKRDAFSFYCIQGFTSQQAKNHMQGIDFAKSVDAGFLIQGGSKIAQWKNHKLY